MHSLGPIDFQIAQWLAGGASASEAASAVLCRGDFELSEKPVSACLRFAAVGLLEPWVNGERVGEDYLTPGWSDFRRRAYVCEYGVEAFLEAGKNCLGFVLGNGWGGVPFGPHGHARQLGPDRCFIAEVEVRYADGTVIRLGTGPDWRWRKGPILAQSIYHGEHYDARRECPGWSEPGSSLRGWSRVEQVPDPDLHLQAKVCPPVRVTETVEPVKRHWDGSGWIYDFGQNLVGVPDLRLGATKPGQKVVLKFAEMLQADGSLYLENLRHAAATDVYICRGGEEESYSPRFTFHGFRYARIEGAEPASLSARVLHNDLRPTGRFSCSSPKINRLQSSIRWGQRGNFLEAPTDCPQRDERLGWSGDAQVFVETACFNYDCAAFYRQWMDAMRDGQQADGAFPDVAPDILGWHGNAGWGDAGVIVPHAIWLHYGECAIIEENWVAMERYMDFLAARAPDLIQPETVYGDWLAVDAARPQWAPTPKDMIGTAYHAYDACLRARMARATGRLDRAAHYEALNERIKKAFVRRFVTVEGLVLGDTQTSYLIALGFDLLPENLREAAARRLVERIEARQWHLSTGFIGTPLLNRVLSKVGRGDVAENLLFQESYPSWLYPILNGATTMWERWNSWTRENGFGPVEMNSFNHYAYGAIGQWLYQSVGGIAPDPEAPGFRRAILTLAPGRLRRARVELDTRAGHYRSAWRVSSRNLLWEVRIPEQGEGKVCLPDLPWRDIRLNGKAVPRARRLGTGQKGLRLGPGRHRIEFPCPPKLSS